MSEIPHDQLSYRHVVAEYYLGLRGAGLMLSPLDVEQVVEWEQRGIPVAVVCRGLRRGFEEHLASRPAGSPRPRSLRALRGAVESEWRGYRSGRVGEAPAPPPEQEAAAARIDAARSFLSGAPAWREPWALPGEAAWPLRLRRRSTPGDAARERAARPAPAGLGPATGARPEEERR